MSMLNAYLPNKEKIAQEELRNRKLIQLMDQTGYPLVQLNGQRVFGPPPYWTGPKPNRGSEIFVGKLPRFIFEDELVPLFSKIGPIYQIRLMLDFSGLNRGYAFVTYMKTEHATLAINYLNNYEIRRKRHIAVLMSLDNCRLYVGGIPLNKSKEELWGELEDYVEGINNVIMYPAYECTSNNLNRGYAFVEFCDHKAAAIARRQLGCGVRLWNAPIAIDWADPLPDVDPAIMEKVTRLYIRNLDFNLTSEALYCQLMRHIPGFMISSVYKVADYAFVHFKQRCDAEYALNILQGAVIAGKQIEVSWARPYIYSKAYRMNKPAQHFCVSVPPKLRKVIRQQKEQQQASGRVERSSSEPTASASSQFSSNHNSRGSVNINVNNPVINILNVNMLPLSATEMPYQNSCITYAFNNYH